MVSIVENSTYSIRRASWNRMRNILSSIVDYLLQQIHLVAASSLEVDLGYDTNLHGLVPWSCAFG